MKIKLFTHTDLDGVGCSIVAKLAFPEVDVEYCNYDDINERVESYIANQDYRNYKITFITDISVNEQMAKMIDTLAPVEEFVLLDHHKTALWLNKYKWAYVAENLNHETKHSGTFMFYLNVLDYYVETYSNTYNLLINASNFFEAIRRYDTWEWKTKYLSNTPKLINDLLYLKGRDRFVRHCLESLVEMEEFELSPSDVELLLINQERIDRYVEDKNKTLIVEKIFHHPVGVVFAEQYHSELGNRLAELHPELDFIVIINPSQSVSYRTVKDDVDLSQIAKMFGGGGHPKAAGSPINEELRDRMIQLVLQSGNWSCGG